VSLHGLACTLVCSRIETLVEYRGEQMMGCTTVDANQPTFQRMTMPARAPTNNKAPAVDWMKNPGRSFSTALL
jgi:hypothetical protein